MKSTAGLNRCFLGGWTYNMDSDEICVTFNHNSEICESQGPIFFPFFLVWYFCTLGAKKYIHLYVFHTFLTCSAKSSFTHIISTSFSCSPTKTHTFPSLAHTTRLSLVPRHYSHHEQQSLYFSHLIELLICWLSSLDSGNVTVGDK